MAFQNKTLTCKDCGNTFVFTIEEQEFFASKGFNNEPKRCPACRQKKRSERAGNNDHGGPRQLYPATCALCGRETMVPFQPRGDKPVYCRECYEKIKNTEKI